MGTSIQEFSADLPEYRDRINAQVLPLLEWLRTKGVTLPAGEYIHRPYPRGGTTAMSTDGLSSAQTASTSWICDVSNASNGASSSTRFSSIAV